MKRVMKNVFGTICFAVFCAGATAKPFVESVTTGENGSDTFVREFYPDKAVDLDEISGLTLRSRNVPGSFRHQIPVLRFDLRSISAETVKYALLKLYVKRPSLSSFSVDVYGVIDGTAGDGTGPVDQLDYDSADWFLKRNGRLDRDLDPEKTALLGTIEYKSGVQGEMALRAGQALADFLNADSNGFVTLVLEAQQAGEDEDFFVEFVSGADAVYGDFFRPTLEFSAERAELNVGEKFNVKLIERIDSETGNKVVQLTSLPGFNQGFYYHKNPIVPDSNWVVYRHIDVVEASQRTGKEYQYFKVNVKSGETVALSKRGSADAADLHGEWLYHTTMVDDETWLVRRNVNSFKLERLYRLEWPVAGHVSVNADGSQVLVMMEDPESLEARKGLWDESRRRRLVAVNTEDRSVKELLTVDVWVAHTQCSPVDPDLYTIIDQRERFRTMEPGSGENSHLQRLCIGHISKGVWGPLSSDDPFLNGFGNFAHPWWGADGCLWSDGLWNPKGLLAFKPGPVPEGKNPVRWPIESYEWYPGDKTTWQHHHNRTAYADWFVGDGAYPEAHTGRGSPFIQLFHAAAGNDKAVFYRLCRNYWNSPVRVAGYRGPNSHMLSDGSGVVFQDLIDFEHRSLRPLNLFMVVVPEELCEKMRDSE